MQTVKELMSKNPKTCQVTESILCALEVMRTFDCGSVPIVDAENVLRNIITDRDISLCLLDTPKAPKDIKIHDCVGMERNVIFVSPEDDIHKAIDLMEEHQVRRLPVCDDQRRCIGIVAQADIALKDRSMQDVVDLLHDISEKRQSMGANP